MKINTIGWAVGFAANDVNTALGPWYWYYHPELLSKHIKLQWQNIIYCSSEFSGLQVAESLTEALGKLAHSVANNLQERPLLILGGDHTIAMGTWPEIQQKYANLGLIWVDAHLDSHTPDSSQSKNFHGMSLARLLGVWGGEAVFKPNQVCVIGARSYESAEYELLQQLGVKIIMMEEIRGKNVQFYLQEALDYLKISCAHLGLSIDLDAFDPLDCPGVGCPEQNGIKPQDFFDFFKKTLWRDWVAIEVVEFNPILDKQQKTAKWLAEFLDSMYNYE